MTVAVKFLKLDQALRTQDYLDVFNAMYALVTGSHDDMLEVATYISDHPDHNYSQLLEEGSGVLADHK